MMDVGTRTAIAIFVVMLIGMAVLSWFGYASWTETP